MPAEKHTAELVQELTTDLRKRWRSGDRVPAEQYTADHPQLQSDHDALLDLIYSEIAIREELGDSPQPEEYVRRFPPLADELTALFEVHRAATDGELIWDEEAGAAASAATDWIANADTQFEPGDGDSLPKSKTRFAAASHLRLVSRYARGGLGQVSVAWDEELGREVALKEIQTPYAHFPEIQNRFLREAKITAELQHPGIVPVYGLYRLPDGRPCYAMRLIEGRNLADAIKQFHDRPASKKRSPVQGIDLRRLLRCFVDACNAVAYAHSHGIVHRDLKPGNIVLGDFGETVVVDWGLAKPLAESPPASVESETRPAEEATVGTDLPPAAKAALTRWGSAIGTAPFMSPEQADGRLDQVTPASDVYSLGATLHCLLTGRPPHDNCDLSAIRERFREGHVCRPSEVSRHVPRALEAICVKAMAIRPQQRYDSVRALAADVERWLADEPVTAWHEPRIIRIARWARRHQSLMAATVAAVVVGLLGLAAASHLLASARIERHVSQARLEQAEADAERQKQLANQLFHREHAFIEKYSSGFDGTTALDPSQSFSLEKKLFEMVHDHYRDYVAEAPLHDVSPADIATAYYRLGMVCSMQGDLPAAINAHQEGIEIQRQLASQRPNDRRLRRDLAKSLRELAPLHFMSRDLQASKAMLNEALAIHREMVGQIPDNTEDRCGVAICQHFLATVHHAEGDAETARQINQEAIDLLAPMTAEELADDEHPENVRFCLVSCYRLHAQLLQAAGHHQEALRATQAASRLKDELGRSMSRRMREALRPLSPMEVGPPAPFSSNPPTSLWESIRDLLPKRRVHRDAEQGDEAPDVGAP